MNLFQVIVQHLNRVGTETEHEMHTDMEWFPPPRESVLAIGKNSFKLHKVDQLVDLFADSVTGSKFSPLSDFEFHI